MTAVNRRAGAPKNRRERKGRKRTTDVATRHGSHSQAPAAAGSRERVDGAPPPLLVGPRLKSLRRQQRLSLRALAKRTGFSASFLSQVERGETSPSLASLQKIGAALMIELPDLLRPPDRPGTGPVIRAGERPIVRSEWSRASAAPLVTWDESSPMAALLLTLDRAGRTGSIRRPAGTSGFAYCLRGNATVTLDGEMHRVGVGDCLLLDGAVSARWENAGRSQAQVLWVSVRRVVVDG